MGEEIDAEKCGKRDYLTTVVRSALSEPTGSAKIAGSCQLQLPTGPQSPRVVFLIDVVVSATPGDGARRFRFSRLDVYELCHVLLATAMDVVAPTVFPTMSDKPKRHSLCLPPPPIGPSIYLMAGDQKNLSDFIDLTGLQRAPGADVGRINAAAAIETPFCQRLETFEARDGLVKEGLTTTLAASEFLEAETAIRNLSVWPELEHVLGEVRPLPRSRLRRLVL